MEWIKELTGKVKWSKKGTLSLKNSLPDVVPNPVQFYLSSILPNDLANALTYIQKGATHYFAQGNAGIIFYGDNDDAWLSSSSSMSSEDDSSNCTESSDENRDETSENDSTSTGSYSEETDEELQPGEVGFVVGHKRRAKYKMKEKDFLKVMKTLLIIRREQNHKDIPGQQDFIRYVNEIKKDEGGCQPSNVHRHVTEESAENSTITVTDRTTTSIAVAWEASIDNSRYTPTIEPIDGGFDSIIAPISGNINTCIFDGLEPGTAYKVVLKSDCLTQTCETSTYPASPKCVNIMHSSSECLTVKWDPPEGKVESFRVHVDPNQILITTCSNEHTFLNLTPGGLYTITLQSCSNGEYSSPISERIQMVPCKPMLSVYNTTEDSITVEYERLKGDSDSCELMVALSTNPNACVNGVTNLEPQSHWKYCFSALKSGTEYEISAIARSGETQSEKFTTTVRTRVDAPSNLRIVEQDEDGTTIGWSAATGYVDEYRIVLSSGGEIVTEKSVRAFEELKLSFVNLVPGRTYRASVSSVIIDKKNDDVADKSLTASLDFHAMLKRPNVTIERASVQTNSLKISWYDVTGERDQYRVSISPPDSDKSESVITAPSINTGEKLSRVFENLTPGKMYTVTVVTIAGKDESEGDIIQQTTKPDKPKLRKVNSVVNERQYSLEWDNSDGVIDTYKLALKPAVDEMWELCPQRIFETKENSIIVDLVQGIKYCVSLWAVSGEETSLIETSTVTVLPAQPLDVKVSSTDTTITVTWKEAAGAKTGYIVKLWNPMSKTEVKNIEHGKQLETCFMNCIRGREYELTICTVAGIEQTELASSPVSHKVQTVPSTPAVRVEHTDLSSIKVSWSEVDGDKTGYCLSIHEPDGQCMASREISIKREGWIYSWVKRWIWPNCYQEIFDELCPGRRYEIRALTRSRVGKSDSTPVVVQTEVSPVRNIQVEPSPSDTGLTVKWDPVNGDVDKYIVTLETSSGTEINQAEVKEATHTFNNLKPGVKYHIRVKSVSEDKSSTEKEVTTIVRPCKPEELNVEPNGPQSLKVSWKEAKGEKTHYVVTISPEINGGNGETIVETGQPLVCTYSELISGREYTVTVITVSEDVEGYPEKMSQTTLVSAPGNVFVKDRTEENLTVSWTPGKGLVDRYHVRAVPVVYSGSSTIGDEVVASVEHTDKENVCTVGTLQPGTCYDIYVKAESNGRFSDESHTQTSTLVSRVTGIHVSDETTESFKVGWIESPGQKIHYILYVDPGEEVIVYRGPDKNLNHEFTGLKPGLEYKVVIRTGNDTNKSDPTETLAWTQPLPPEYVELTSVGEDSLTVRWCRPKEGSYDNYKVSISPSDDETVAVEGEMTEHTFDGLIAGRKYIISVSTIFHSLESTPKAVEISTDVRPPTLEIQPCGISQEHVTLSVKNYRCECDEYKIMVESVGSGEGYLKTVRRETDEDVHILGNLVPGRKYNISAMSVTQNQNSAVCSITTRTSLAKVTGIRTEARAKTCTIAWEEAPGDKDGYFVQLLSKHTGKREQQFVKGGQNILQYTFRKLTPGRLYEISVRTASVKDEGTRLMSHPICKLVQTAVVADIHVECRGHTDTNITVRWLDVDGDKTNYKLWIIPSDGDNAVKDVPIPIYQSQTHKPVYNETFTGLQPGRKYQIFCQTISGDTSSEESVIEVQTDVCPPQDVQVSTAWEHSLPVTWSHAKGDKDSYKLRLVLDKTEVASDTVPVPPGETHGQLSYTFRNLNAGYEYELEISTLSGKQYSVVKRYTAQTRPSPIQHVTVAKYGTEGLKVTWHETEGKVSYYDVDISPSDGWKRQQVQWNPKRFYEWIYSRLTPGRRYTISVTTVSGVAESEPMVIEETTVVAKPENVKVEHREETSMTLSWNPAAGDKDGYLTTIEPLVSDPSSNEVVPTNFIPHKEGRMSYTFRNLQPGRQYLMTLKTESCGHYSEEETVKARVLVSPPKTLKVTDITTETMTLTWSEADGDKDYYQIEISPADGSNTTGKVIGGEDTCYTFSGLTPGKRYSISIWTVSGGARSRCETSSVRTCPNAPGNVVPKIVGKCIKVAWEPVEGELDSYLLHLKPSKDTDENPDEVWHTVRKCDPTSHIFPHLIPGRLYEITVQTVSDNRQSSPFTISQRLPIDTPKALKKSCRAERRIAVDWDAATGDKDCYRVKLLNGHELVKDEETTNTTWTSDELIPGTLYTICVQTICEKETSDATTIQVRTVACSPTSVYVGNVTERTISVSWPDADGNKDKYSVQICDEEGIEVDSTELPSTILEKTFKHLVPGRLYQICIKSLCGNDDMSTSSTICQQQRTNVSQPGNIVKENVGLDRMSFSWGKALGDVDYYTVDVSSSDPEENIPKVDSVSKDSLESTVDGLTAGRLYSISVTAVSGDDYGEPRTLRVRTKVDKPKQPQIAAVGENTLVVIWDHATGDKDRYVLTIDPEHATCTSVDANDELSQTFTNLVPGTLYRISITTIKGDHNSEASYCEGWTRPLPPPKIRLSNISEKSITVAWDHVSEGGYGKYKVTIEPDDASECLLSADNQTHDFHGLTPGREYTVSVVTVFGDGLISRRQTSRIRTTVNTPNLIIDSQNVTKNSIPVQWKPSEGDCDQYKLTICSEKETERKSVTIPNGSSGCFEHEFNALVPGREYIVSLVAISGRDYSKPSRRVQRTIVATPACLNLSSTEDCIGAEWENAEGDASGYLVILSSTSPSDEKKEKFIRSGETFKTVFDELVPGRIYTITIHTVVKPTRGDAVFSSPVSRQKRTEVKPPKLYLDMVTETSIRVKWPDVLGDSDEYRLHISPTDESPVRLPVAIEKYFQDQHHTFEDLVPGKRYEITAVTVSGGQDSKAETMNVRTLVCSPKNIRSGATKTEITVQWDEPDGEYDGFHLRLSSSDAQQSEVSNDKAKLCHSFTNLVSGRKYKITIAAMNEGERSEDVTISIQTQVADVDPEELVVVPDGDGKLRASWKHCEGDKQGYLIMISPNDTTSGPTRFIKFSNPLEYKYVDLVPGRLYYITLCAVSYEERSKGIRRQVRATVAPPRDVCINTKTGKSMSVSWNGSKGEVDGYLVSISDDLATLQEVGIKHKGDDILMSYTFHKLTPGRMYTVSVTAIREGDSSLTISPPPSRTIVSQPNDVQIVEETVNSIRVSWLEADGCKDGYYIEITDAHGHHHQEPQEVALQKDKLDANDAPEYSYVFTNLVAGKRYLIRVLAESGNDRSSWAATFGRTIPLPPQGVEAETAQETDIIVRWKSDEGEFDKHSLFLYSENVTTGVSDSELGHRATDKHFQTGLPVSKEEGYESTFIQKRWVDVTRNQATAHTFSGLEHGRLYVIEITTKSGDKESEPKRVMIRTTVDTPKELRETYHDETCIAVKWDHARGVKDKYIVDITSNDYLVDSKCVEADSRLKCTFDGLYPGRLYAVSVRTSCGESFSKPLEGYMRTTAIPPETILIDEDDVKERAITLTWPEAQCDKDHYRVTLIPAGNGDQGESQEAEISSDVQMYSFSKLIPGQLYKISICTLTDRKECESKPVVIHRRTRVAEVNNLRISQVDFTSLTVEWDPADGVQERYQIDLNHDGQQQQAKCVDKVGPRPFKVVFDDLTEGRLYTVHVITISGDETVSTMISKKTKVRPPTD